MLQNKAQCSERNERTYPMRNITQTQHIKKKGAITTVLVMAPLVRAIESNHIQRVAFTPHLLAGRGMPSIVRFLDSQQRPAQKTEDLVA